MNPGPRHRLAMLSILAGMSLAACAIEDPGVKPYERPTAGLYTPESQIGASDPTDFPSEENLGDRCKPLMLPDAGTPTEGTLSVEFESQTLMMRFAPSNYTAIWIETVDGAHVDTIEVSEGIHKDGLAYWRTRACVEKVDPDVVSSATRKTHFKRDAEWDGLDFEGNPVPDGPYTLWIEVTEDDDELGVATEFDFQKGPTMSGGPQQIPPNAGLASISITWTPGGGE